MNIINNVKSMLFSIIFQLNISFENDIFDDSIYKVINDYLSMPNNSQNSSFFENYLTSDKQKSSRSEYSNSQNLDSFDNELTPNASNRTSLNEFDDDPFDNYLTSNIDINIYEYDKKNIFLYCNDTTILDTLSTKENINIDSNIKILYIRLYEIIKNHINVKDMKCNIISPYSNEDIYNKLIQLLNYTNKIDIVIENHPKNISIEVPDIIKLELIKKTTLKKIPIYNNRENYQVGIDMMQYSNDKKLEDSLLMIIDGICMQNKLKIKNYIPKLLFAVIIIYKDKLQNYNIKVEYFYDKYITIPDFINIKNFNITNFDKIITLGNRMMNNLYDALLDLQSNDYIHYAIKWGNILLDKEDNIMLINLESMTVNESINNIETTSYCSVFIQHYQSSLYVDEHINFWSYFIMYFDLFNLIIYCIHYKFVIHCNDSDVKKTFYTIYGKDSNILLNNNLNNHVILWINKETDINDKITDLLQLIFTYFSHLKTFLITINKKNICTANDLVVLQSTNDLIDKIIDVNTIIDANTIDDNDDNDDNTILAEFTTFIKNYIQFKENGLADNKEYDYFKINKDKIKNLFSNLYMEFLSLYNKN